MGRKNLSQEEINRISAEIITATKKLISISGLDNLAARTIANETGLNAAIIYRHFADIDELKAFACLDLFQEYVTSLAAAVAKHKPRSAKSRYILSWKLFCEHCFEHPRTAFTIFFGKHADRTSELIKKYYELFPEKNISVDLYNDMLKRGNLFERNMEVLSPVLFGQKNHTETEQINEITVLYFKGLLESKIQDLTLNKQALSKKMLNACELLIK